MFFYSTGSKSGPGSAKKYGDLGSQKVSLSYRKRIKDRHPQVGAGTCYLWLDSGNFLIAKQRGKPSMDDDLCHPSGRKIILWKKLRRTRSWNGHIYALDNHWTVVLFWYFVHIHCHHFLVLIKTKNNNILFVFLSLDQQLLADFVFHHCVGSPAISSLSFYHSCGLKADSSLSLHHS